jgi:hypothetical protein
MATEWKVRRHCVSPRVGASRNVGQHGRTRCLGALTSRPCRTRVRLIELGGRGPKALLQYLPDPKAKATPRPARCGTPASHVRPPWCPRVLDEASAPASAQHQEGADAATSPARSARGAQSRRSLSAGWRRASDLPVRTIPRGAGRVLPALAPKGQGSPPSPPASLDPLFEVPWLASLTLSAAQVLQGLEAQ